jgi:ribosomal protein S18 acetylase RimI-like enzyme
VIELVAVDGHQVIGILDVEIGDELATIDTIAVHPDHQRRGIGTALLHEAERRLRAFEAVTTLDAWTREDPQALGWYRSRGFAESEHYLHVYKGNFEPADGWGSPKHLSRPVMAFAHAALEYEDELRERFARVYVCRRFSRPVCPPSV